MGLSLWRNPAANPLLMLAFQVGMFAFWATVATAPRVFLDPREPSRRARRRIVRFSVPYFAVVYIAAFSVPTRLRFATLVPLIVAGYSVVAGLLLRSVVDLAADPDLTSPADAKDGRT